MTFGPNVTGKYQIISGYQGQTPSSVSVEGAITKAPTYNGQGLSPSGAVELNGGFIFNASLSNSVYTDSGHVYPASIALNFIIKT